MEKLPDEAKRFVCEYDNTYREKFDVVMIELTNKMRHRYIKTTTYSDKSIYKKEIYPVASWSCEISLRRKSKRSNYLIKRKYPLIIRGDVIYPYEHNRKACELSAKREVQECRNTNIWKRFVCDYLQQTECLMRYFKNTDGRYLRLLN